MWEILEEETGNNKFVEIAKNLYRNTMRKIKTPTGYTKMTKYSIGVKQGCILSPNFFTLFILAASKTFAVPNILASVAPTGSSIQSSISEQPAK